MARICLSVPKVDAGPQAFTVFPTDESHANSWVFDSGASTHMTNDPGKLCSLSPYYGPDMICVGNGAALPIKFFGSFVIPIGSRNLVLNDVLVSSALTKNLVSIRKLTADNNCVVKFTLSGFCVKDMKTKHNILSSSS